MTTDRATTAPSSAGQVIADRAAGRGRQEAFVGLALLALGLALSAACSLVAVAVGADSPVGLLFVNLVLLLGGVATASVGLVEHLVER